MRTIIRVTGVEILQNLPFSFGLIYAIHAETWPSRFAIAGIGALGTAALIAATERIKLNKLTPERPADLIVNTLSFFGAEIIYVVYYVLVRPNTGNALLTDVAGGALLGTLVGILQAFLIDERRITRQAVKHTGGFILVGIFVSFLLGVIARSGPSLLASIVVCLLMTAIIVSADYRAYLTSGRISGGPKAT